MENLDLKCCKGVGVATVFGSPQQLLRTIQNGNLIVFYMQLNCNCWLWQTEQTAVVVHFRTGLGRANAGYVHQGSRSVVHVRRLVVHVGYPVAICFFQMKTEIPACFPVKTAIFRLFCRSADAIAQSLNRCHAVMIAA